MERKVEHVITERAQAGMAIAPSDAILSARQVKMLRTRMFLAAAGLLVASQSEAARFCLRNQSMTPLCIYDDAKVCERDATKQNGVCTINEREVRLPRGVGGYCVVISGGIANCAYGDRETCTQAASRQGGICTATAQLAPYRAPDPDSPVNGR